MNWFRQEWFRMTLVILGVAALGSTARADIVYNESVSGDLSNVQNAPTMVTLTTVGINSVIGNVGAAVGDQQDWITITVPTGMTLNHLVLAAYTSTDNQGFIGFQAGTKFVGNAQSDPTAYLGYAHFGKLATNGSLPAANLTGADLLPIMANPAAAPNSKGFAIPLASGSYAFLIQQTGASTAYQFDFVTASTAVPEPSSLCLLGALIGGGAGARAVRKWRAKVSSITSLPASQ
jgi:hypothetical protein